MRPAAALLGLAGLLVTGPALAQARDEGRRGPPHGPGWADPSDVISADIAFSRLAQEKGRWAAFRATAAKGAQQFAPGPVRVEAVPRPKTQPEAPLAWQPHAAWMACDGTYAVTRGAWQSGKAAGWYMTVWQRQDKGGYKWVLDQGDTLAQPLPPPEFLTAKVADCPARHRPAGDPPAARKPDKPAIPAEYLSGASPDGTLAWTTTLAPDGDRTGARSISVRLRSGGTMAEVAAATIK
ncbi:MAG: hypothetical protein KGM17_08350 [Sphingomonadales bacterium]|nr:hypothetical protein [Sphingomonadales bacterium]